MCLKAFACIQMNFFFLDVNYTLIQEMLKYSEATPYLVSTTSASLETLDYQLCDPTAGINLTPDIQHALRKAAPRRRESVRPQRRSESLGALPTEAFSNGAAKAKNLSDHAISDRQPNTHDPAGVGAALQVLLSARCRASVLTSERYPNNPFLMIVKG